MSRVTLTRTVRFRATHHYVDPTLTDEENRARFGDLSRPHGHDYTVSVTVAASGEERSDFVVDLAALDHLLRERLVKRFHGQDLNHEIDEVRTGRMMPSTEAFARWIAGDLEDWIPGEASLASVRVAESDTLAATFEVG